MTCSSVSAVIAGAAGFEIATDRWDAFRSRFLASRRTRAPTIRGLRFAIDLALPAAELDYALVASSPPSPRPVPGTRRLSSPSSG